jgi:hypothetical protein
MGFNPENNQMLQQPFQLVSNRKPSGSISMNFLHRHPSSSESAPPIFFRCR